MGRVPVGGAGGVGLGSDGLVERDDLLDLFHVQDLPSVDNARGQYSWDIRINAARKCERPRRSLHDDMDEVVQDVGERGVQDGADRFEAVTVSASRGSAYTIASAAVSRRARAIHPTVDRVPSLPAHRAGHTGRAGCPAVRRPVK
ncbi:hypothetical protein ACH41H_41840 [Streptomyces sp. NPDC020800]|uniref:hypothetical protein n=1 Tax=Streptomyces sp. NPDC020800 TaxID=3365092 RepID=UPI0037BAB553